MADEVTATASVHAPTAVPATEPNEPSENTESAQANGDTTMKKPDEDAVVAKSKSEEPAAEADQAEGADRASAEASADAMLSSGGKDKKRKSTGGVPEHKTKKLNKKKSMPTLHLECKPGEFYWARLKGYPPWPSVICDEEMLPESLLATRPVSTARPDGSIRDDFKEGGKNAKERTFPIMFLSTNEFQWMINTNLTPLDPEECKTLPQSKMTKALQKAYQIASENHPIQYFKGILHQWQEEEEAIQREQEEIEAEAERLAAERAAKAADEADMEKSKKKKASRKSKGANDDVDMEDADAPKSSKKRKKNADESEADAPKRTPKITKLNAPKTPNGEASASKKSNAKSKKKVVTAPKTEQPDESKPQLTEEEKLQQREKAVLYLRHRLQKGFLSRDQAPQESEMAGMAEFFGQLEAYEDLEPQIIRATKIHKVLKAVIKLASIPKDAEYDFKKRSSALLEIWNKRMEADTDAAPTSAVETSKPANGQENGDKSTAAGKEESAEAATETKDTEMKEAPPAAAEEQPEQHTTDNNTGSAETKIDVAAEPSEAPVEKSADIGNDAKDEKDEADGDVGVNATAEETTA